MGLGAAGTAAAIGATGAIGSSLINSGSSPSGQTTSTAQSAPWTGEQPDLYKALGAAGNLYSSNPLGPSYYPSDTYAGLNNNENSALGTLYTRGTNGTPVLNNAETGVASIANGNYVEPTVSSFDQSESTLGGLMNSADPSSNPYLKQAAATTTAQVLPGLQAGFNSGGRADSGDAAYAASSGLASALGSLNYGQYNTGVGQELSAAQQAGTNYGQGVSAVNQAGLVAPGLNAASMGNLEEAYNAGDTQQQNTQNQLDADISRYNYGQEQPYNAISLLEGEITGNGSTSSSSTPYYSNGLANALSGGTSALGLYNAFGGSSLFGNNNAWSNPQPNASDASGATDSFSNYDPNAVDYFGQQS